MKISKHNCQLTSENSISIIRQYDVVLDATDNVATRYLLNDSCIFARKPLVSGSALQTEGQLTVYNHLSSPCYRCLYPQPPPANAVNNCSSSGVLGPSKRLSFDSIRNSSIAYSLYFIQVMSKFSQIIFLTYLFITMSRETHLAFDNNFSILNDQPILAG